MHSDAADQEIRGAEECVPLPRHHGWHCVICARRAGTSERVNTVKCDAAAEFTECSCRRHVC